MDTIRLAEGLAALVALLFIYQLWPRKKGETSPGPPEADGARPVVGHLGLLTGTTPLHKILSAVSDKHGPLFTLRLGQMRVLVVSSIGIAKECFTTNDRAFASRPPLQCTKLLGYDRCMFGLAPYGPYWREMRKITTIELLSNRPLDMLKHIRVEEVGTLVRGLYTSCQDGKPVDMKRRLSHLTMNIIVRMVAGRRYFDTEGESKDEAAKEFGELIEEFFYLLGAFTVSDALPWLEWLDVGGHVKAMRRVHDKMDRVASAWVEGHRLKRRSGCADGDSDFIDVLISQLDDKHWSGHLSQKHQADTVIKATALAMVSAGTDTTSATLEWTLSLLLNNRHALKKLRDELDVHVGRERPVDESDIQKLPYLQAVLKESMRLHPVAPLLVAHQSFEPVQVGGYHVPVGTTLFVNAWKIFRDPTQWSDPEEFKPERFLTSHVELNFSGQSTAFMPFGSGRRMCPGSSLAVQVAHLALARLIQSFDWWTPTDGPVDMTEGFGMTMPKATPLLVMLKPRLPPHLYQ